MIELKYPAPKPEGSYVDINLQAVLSYGDEAVKVKGFLDVDASSENELSFCYKIRFLPKHSGRYHYAVSGVANDEGDIDVKAEQCTDSLVHAADTHFEYENGSCYYPFGTTVYAMVHQSDELLNQTLATLGKAPFNKIRFCVFPKHYLFNENEPPCFPFQRAADGHFEIDKPDFTYWQRLENVIKQLDKMHIQADLILFHPYDCWGFAHMTMQENLIYLDYLLRRLSAFSNVWWSLANEYDLMFDRSEAEWYQMEQFIADNDPYSHMMSNHDFVKLYDFSRKNITHCCIQSNDVFRTASFIENYMKPVIFDEMCYEGNISEPWGNISAREMVKRFWKVCAVGGYATHGETYLSPDDVLWWGKGGTLKGESPERIRFLKTIIAGIGGPLKPWEELSLKEFLNSDECDADGVHPMVKLVDALDVETRSFFNMKNVSFTGCYEDKVFVKYYAEQCPAVGTLLLPEKGEFEVTIVDTWEMKTETLPQSVHGKISFKLPGKEGMAVIAKNVQ